MSKEKRSQHSAARMMRLLAAGAMGLGFVGWIVVGLILSNLALATLFTLLPASATFILLLSTARRLETQRV